ncbi:hypothetical protein QQ045_019050 [Rhodiola kirilowii]
MSFVHKRELFDFSGMTCDSSCLEDERGVKCYWRLVDCFDSLVAGRSQSREVKSSVAGGLASKEGAGRRLGVEGLDSHSLRHAGIVVEVSTSKTGKHGHAKCHFVAIGIFNGKKLEDIVPSSHNCDVPHVTRTDYQLIDISEDGFLSISTLLNDAWLDVVSNSKKLKCYTCHCQVSLLTENGNTRDDLKLPTDDNLPTSRKRKSSQSKGTLDDAEAAVGKITRKKLKLVRPQPDVASKGTTTTSKSDSDFEDSNIHGILNVISWGVLMPAGAMFARYLKVSKAADPAWFYLHIACQTSAYIIGVDGWGTGLKLGSKSVGVTHSVHGRIGIALFCLGTLQVFALLLRPKKNHKIILYWNVYHHAKGYAVIILGIINIYKYTGVIIALGALVVILELFTWVVVLRRKKSEVSD